MKKEEKLKLNFRQKLTLIHLVTIIFIVTATALFSWWRLSIVINGQLDAALVALAETEADMMMFAHDEQEIRVHDSQHEKETPSLSRIDRLIQIVDPQGFTIAKSHNLGNANLPIQKLRSRFGKDIQFATVKHFANEPLRVVIYPVEKNHHRYFIIVAGSLDDIHQTLDSATFTFVSMTIVLALAITWASAIPIKRLLKVIDHIVTKAKEISQDSLNLRLPHDDGQDEISKLIETLNEMLSRLEQSFLIQKSFTAHASHELRSPLSRMRTDIEVTLRRSRDSQTYLQTVQSCLVEVENLTNIVHGLMLLAELDAKQTLERHELVSVTGLVNAAVRLQENAFREKGIQLNLILENEFEVRTHREFATLIISNILDNAVKYSPAGTSILVKSSSNQGRIELNIIDAGDGFLQDELPFIFDRFFRGRESLKKQIPGCGLGLALVKILAEFSGCVVTASQHSGGGACFTIKW